MDTIAVLAVAEIGPDLPQTLIVISQVTELPGTTSTVNAMMALDGELPLRRCRQA